MQEIAKVEGATIKIAGIMAKESLIKFEKHEKPEFNKGDKEGDKVTEDNQISLQNVCFHYPSKPDVPVIHDFSIDIKRNHIVALVGSSGCGKSSIICLVERWYDPVSGRIMFNDTDLKDIDNKWYHQT